MRRREFLTAFGGTAVCWPVTAHAQQLTLPIIGFLNSASPNLYAHLVRAFRQGLSENGYVEGTSVLIEYRWAEGRNDRLPALAVDLVQRRVAVIVANSPAAVAAKATTATIPIVFNFGTDPVQFGLVASLHHPGGNLTGVTNLNVEVGPKRLELLRELIPTAASAALLVNPSNPILAEPTTRDLQAAAHSLGLKLHVLHAGTDRELETAFAALVQIRAEGLVIGADPFFNRRSERLAALSAGHAVPAIYQYREFAMSGGLISYGGSLTDVYRQLGVYAARILKGEKPADLPVQQATKMELIINLKTAKALGLVVPLTLLGRADEVIEGSGG